MPRLHNEPNIAVVFLFNYLKDVFLCVPVTKGTQFDQFDWPTTLRNQVSTYNKDINVGHVI